jgi:undecaprenyl diphosphate synthase
MIPKHVVIIPDGNRRWAKEKNLPSIEGHRVGFNRFKEVVREAQKLGIKTLTIWGFSTENWDRSKEEVDYLFKLFKTILTTFSKEAIKNEVRFRHLGRKSKLPRFIINALVRLENKTKKFSNYNLNLALDYGGRDEIVRAINKILACRKSLKDIDNETFNQYLDTAGLDDPDLIIRTSGEQRLSGMLPWQAVYAELYFPKVYFPDFDKKAFHEAIAEFSRRKRRFGK